MPALFMTSLIQTAGTKQESTYFCVFANFKLRLLLTDWVRNSVKTAVHVYSLSLCRDRDVSSIGFPFNVPSSALHHMTSENIDCFSTSSHPMIGHIRMKHRSSIRKNLEYYTPPSNPNSPPPPPLRPKKEEEETTNSRQPEVYCKSTYSFVIFKRLL